MPHNVFEEDQAAGGGTAAIAFGTAGARPAAAAGNAHTGYYATDTGEVTYSDGAAWQALKSTSTQTFTAGGGGAAVFAGLNVDLNFTGTTAFIQGGDLDIQNTGKGLKVAEGANAKQGVATLVTGTVTVANTTITATSRIFLTIQSLGTVTTPKTVGVTARIVGTSFTITSADATDTSVIAYEIFEVG